MYVHFMYDKESVVNNRFTYASGKYVGSAYASIPLLIVLGVIDSY